MTYAYSKELDIFIKWTSLICLVSLALELKGLGRQNTHFLKHRSKQPSNSTYFPPVIGFL